MARLPEFDRTQVVEAALQVFWQDGYTSSTIQKLLRAMDLNRGSLYAAFGDKEHLFREVLDQYVDHMQHILQPTLIGEADPLRAIRSFLERVTVQETTETKKLGCLLFNTISELAHTNPPLAQEATRRVQILRNLFIDRLTQARQQNRIRTDKSVGELADYLVALAAGLRMHCKMHAIDDELQKIIDVGLDSLQPTATAH